MDKIKIGIVKTNDTEYYTELPPEIDKAYSVYAVNSGLNVHCCSLTPSAECVYLTFDYTLKEGVELSEKRSEELYDWMLEANQHNELVAYYNWRDVERAETIKEPTDVVNSGLGFCREYDTQEVEDDQGVRAALDEWIEYNIGNLGC